MTSNPLVDSMHAELAGAGDGLVGNDDLLRGILAGCGDCIKVLDLDGRLQFMSEGGKRVMEVDDFGALKGCPWPKFWTGDGNAQAVAAVADAKAGRTARFRNAANTAKGTPRYWDVQVSPVYGLDGKPSHLLSISRDITEEWNAAEVQKANREREVFLTQELTHRVKNSLATVIAIANQTFHGGAYRERLAAFGARIRALSDAYHILTEAGWSRAAVGDVVQSALLPYRAGNDRFAISGASYTVEPNQALTLALALNELATNALKYGALSVPEGRVDIHWTVNDNSKFKFEWRESGGPAVVAPSRAGFGSRVIRTVLAEDFGGVVEVSYKPTGLVLSLRVH